MIFDVIFSFIFIYIFYLGLKKGLIKLLAGILALVAGWYVAITYQHHFLRFLDNTFGLVRKFSVYLERYLYRINPSLGEGINQEGIEKVITNLPLPANISDVIVGKIGELSRGLYPLTLGGVLGRFFSLTLLSALAFVVLFLITRYLLGFTANLLTKALKFLQPLGFLNHLLGGVINLSIWLLIVVFLVGILESSLSYLLPVSIFTHIDESMIFGFLKRLSNLKILEILLNYFYSRFLELIKSF